MTCCDEQSRHSNGRYKISASELSGADMLDPLEERIQRIQQAYDVGDPGQRDHPRAHRWRKAITARRARRAASRSP